MQPDVGGEWASAAVVGGQIGAKPAASVGAAAGEGGTHGGAAFARIKRGSSKKIGGRRTEIPRVQFIKQKSILKKIKSEDLHYITSRFIIKLQRSRYDYICRRISATGKKIQK